MPCFRLCVCQQPTLLPRRPCTQILVFGGGLRAMVRRGRFSNNNSTMGVTVLAGSTLTVTDSNFTSNVVNKGAIYSSYNSTVVMDNVKITQNTAIGYGAALYCVTGTVTVANSDFSRNSARGAGGAVHVKDRATLTLLDSHLGDNSGGMDEKGCGGAVSAMDSRISITACTFTGNKAGVCGGALYSANTPLITSSASPTHLSFQDSDVVRSTVFKGNVASTGGAIAVYHSSLLVDNSTLNGNSAQSMSPGAVTNFDDYFQLGVGGAINADNSDVTLDNCTLQGNRAVMDGGRQPASGLQQGQQPGLCCKKTAWTTIGLLVVAC